MVPTDGGFNSTFREWFSFSVYSRVNFDCVSGIELQFSCYFYRFAEEDTKKLILSYVVAQLFAFRVCIRDPVDFNASQITLDSGVSMEKFCKIRF